MNAKYKLAAATAALVAVAVSAVALSSNQAPLAEEIPTVQVAVSATPTPTPTPKVAKKYKVPSSRTRTDVDGDKFKTSVIEYKQPFKPVNGMSPDRRGFEYAGIKVKNCLIKNNIDIPVSVSWAPWSLELPEGEIIEAATSYWTDGWSEPLYPVNRILTEGKCVKGWIPFEVPKGKTPDRIVYAPGNEKPMEWMLR